MKDCPDPNRHRRQAQARARRCTTCKSASQIPGAARHPCIGGCGALVTSFDSCSPGYCPACAHDPCWQPLV